jgi:hypothetical protein
MPGTFLFFGEGPVIELEQKGVPASRCPETRITSECSTQALRCSVEPLLRQLSLRPRFHLDFLLNLDRGAWSREATLRAGSCM